MKSRCEELAQSLSAFIDGEATREEGEAVRVHLQSCPDCSHAVEAWQTIAAAIDPTRPDRRAQEILSYALRGGRVRIAPLLVAVLVTVGAVGGAGTLLLGGRGGSGSGAAAVSPSPSPSASGKVSPAPASTSPDEVPKPSASASAARMRTIAGAPVPCATKGKASASDVGVTATKVRIGATAPLDGPSASLWGDAAIGMRAAVEEVNTSGGICGRAVELVIRNDSNDWQTGRSIVADMARSTLALAVMPSSNTLTAVIADGTLARARLPVVGAIGLTSEEFGSDWAWSIGTSAHTFATAAVRHAYDHGARTFSIVWSSRPPPAGREIRDAVAAAIRRLPGARLIVQIALDPFQPSYAREVDQYNAMCEPCDATMLVLLPDTAQKWLSRRPTAPAVEGAMTRDLFTDGFAQACASTVGSHCERYVAWTGLMPPMGGAGTKANESYVVGVREQSSTADARNAVIQAAYAGTMVLMEALGRAGVKLTRERLIEVLNTQAYDLGLTVRALRWTPRNRDPNRSMLPCAIVVAQGRFAGWNCGRWYRPS